MIYNISKQQFMEMIIVIFYYPKVFLYLCTVFFDKLI